MSATGQKFVCSGGVVGWFGAQPSLAQAKQLGSYNLWTSQLQEKLWTSAKFYTSQKYLYMILDLKIAYYYNSEQKMWVFFIFLFSGVEAVWGVVGTFLFR